ncbi:unnamed protein product [Caretta caretta]
MVHDDLVSQDGALLGSESGMGTVGSQQQALSGDNEVTLLLKPLPEQALEQEQPEHILGSYSEELIV